MKKFTALALAVLFMMFVTSCGDDKTTEETLPDEEVTDEDKDEPTDEPTNPTDEPTNPTDEPTNPTDEPTNPTDEPTNPTDEPTDPTGEPTTDNDTPGDDADSNTQDDDVIVIPDGDNTEPVDADEIPDEEVETGSCTYIPNSFVSNWTDNFPTGWVSKRDLTGAITVGGKKNFIDYEKIDRGEGNYALRAYIDDPADNLYAFELPPFVPNKNNAALPTKLTFDLKASSTSKISINLRCGDTGTTEDKKYLAYNWKQDLKSFVYSGNNAYDFVNLEDNNFHEVAVVFGDKLTEEFWRGKICRIEFKYGKKKPEDTSADFDIVVDNFVFHTKAGACEQDDIIDEENDDDVIPDADEIVTDADEVEPDADEIVTDADEVEPDADEIVTDADEVEDADEIVTDADEVEDADEITDGDSEPESLSCTEIKNGLLDKWKDDGVTPEDWKKESGLSTFAKDENEALHMVHTNNGSPDAAASTTFVVDENAPIPAGITFKMATNAASVVAINIRWKEGSNTKYHSYKWDAVSQAFVYHSDKENKFYAADFGDANLHDTAIIFGSEITEEFWHGKEFTLQFRYGNKDNNTQVAYNFDISVKDFKFVYYDDVEINEGDTCSKGVAKSVGWAKIKYPHSIEGYPGTLGTFYGRVLIDGLTDQTVGKSIALIGVRAQFCIKEKNASEDLYDCKDAKVNAAESNDFGNNDEYQYTHTFEESGEYDYIFQFSGDNGKNWKKTTDFEEDPLDTQHIGSGYANILVAPENQIPNGDFKYWSGDNPQLWTISAVNSFEKTTVSDGNYALTLNRAKSGSGGVVVLKSPSFNTTADSLLPEKITFKLGTKQTTKISITLNCGGSEKYYAWDKDNNKFTKVGSPTYTNPVDFNDADFPHVTEIVFGEEITNDFWQGKTCYLEFRFNKSADSIATFDDFQIVYHED